MDWCQRRAISVLDLPTAYWHELALAVATRDLAFPSSVRTLIIGGEAALPNRVAQWFEKVPNVRLVNSYGPTEATVVATTCELRKEHGALARVPIGRPLTGVRVCIVSDNGEVVDGPFVHGELAIAGPTLASGYLGAEAGSSKFRYIPDVGRAYMTGDRVCVGRDGDLLFLGRVDDEVKIAGQRVYPSAVEAALASHPSVAEAAVVVEQRADGLRLLVAHVAGPDSESALRMWLSERISSPMVPARIFVHDVLPKTAHGKLDRAALSGLMDVAPVTRTQQLSDAEKTVADIWAHVLGHRSAQPEDDFFAVGGNSLQLIQVANRLCAYTQVRVADLFDNPTLRQQAALIDRAVLSTASEQRPATQFDVSNIDLPTFTLGSVERSSRGLVLLTGATGFVGAYLLEALLRDPSRRVVCLVRAANDEQGLARLVATLERYGLSVDFRRVQVRAVDLTQLAQQDNKTLPVELPRCAQVFHSAAEVSVARSYASLAPINVDATRSLLALAGAWGASFHFVSTIATLPRRQDDQRVEERFYPAHDGLLDGYQQSKWHAERLCEHAGACGIETAVYRLGRVAPGRKVPVINTRDLVWRLVAASARVGVWPELGLEEIWSPVDETAQAVVELAEQASATAPSSVYHLAQFGSVHLNRIRDILLKTRPDMRAVAPAHWCQRVEERGADEDQALLALVGQQGTQMRGPAAAQIDCSSVLAKTSSVSADSTQVDDALLVRYMHRAAVEGLLARPVSTPVRNLSQRGVQAKSATRRQRAISYPERKSCS